MIVGQWLSYFSDEQIVEIILDNYRADRSVTINALRSDGKCSAQLVDAIEEMI